ncbi:MAG TPA: endoglucanase A, partial [Polyangiaceae bacterium]|nr:endoglucanase A [Polyangiaceae bacterium]
MKKLTSLLAMMALGTSIAVVGCGDDDDDPSGNKNTAGKTNAGAPGDGGTGNAPSDGGTGNAPSDGGTGNAPS